MPMVRVVTSVKDVPDTFEAALTTILSQTLVGKPENRIMIELQEGVRLVHGGKPGPVAHVVIKSIGCLGPELNIKHTEVITNYIHHTLNIPRDKIIIEFYDLTSTQVGFNGTTVADAEAKRAGH